MSDRSNKSLQELRNEIELIEQERDAEIKVRREAQAELAKRSPEQILLLTKERDDAQRAHNDTLVQLRQYQFQVQQCVGRVLGYGPNIANIEDLLPKVSQRVKDLEEMNQNLRQVPVNKQLLEDIRKERDEMVMRALDAEKRLREQTQLLQSHLSGVELVKLKKELEAALQAKQELAESSRAINKRYLDLEYKHRDLDIEHADLKKRHQQLQEAEANRTWASTNKNAYDDLLALRDNLVPHTALGNARQAIMSLVAHLQQTTAQAQRETREAKHSAEVAECGWDKEKTRAQELTSLYAELRCLFNIEHTSPANPKEIHATISYWLKRCNEETNKLLEKLEKERALACAEIRRLTDIIKAEGDK